jgi:hypothetical protein
MADLTLNDFRHLPESSIKKMLQYEAEALRQKKAAKPDSVNHTGRFSNITKLFRRYYPQFILLFHRRHCFPK